MDYAYFISRIGCLPMYGKPDSIVTHVLSLVDSELEVLGVQLMRTQVNMLFDEQERTFRFYAPNYLFMGMTSELPEDPVFAPRHCICLEDVPLPPAYADGSLRTNLIVLTLPVKAGTEELLLLLNHAMFYLSDEMRYYRGMEHLSDARIQNGGLAEALALIVSLIVNPAAVIDAFGSVLATCSTYPFLLPELNHALSEGRVPAELLAQLQEKDMYDTLRSAYYSSQDLVWSFTGPLLVVPIRVRGLQAASLIVQSTRTVLHYSTIRLMEPAAQLLAAILGRQMDGSNSRSLLHCLFFNELLRGTPEPETVLSQRAAELHWREVPGMRLLSCRSGSGDLSAFTQLRSALPGCRWTVVGPELLLLLYPSEDEAAPAPALDALLAQVQLRGGLSWPFDHLAELPYASTQAQAALDRGHGVLTDYGRVFPSHAAAVPDDQLVHFVHPAIWRLAAYDRTHDGSLLQTLEAVLSGSDQLSEVAGQLFIHRSTLFYRVNRIRELGHVDLSSGSERLNLLLSLRLLEDRGLLP